jgi:hypothetical protein
VVRQATWFVGADVVDGTGREPVVGAAVEVEGGRIASVGGSPTAGWRRWWRPVRCPGRASCSAGRWAPSSLARQPTWSALQATPLTGPEIFADRSRIALVVQAGRTVTDRR